MTEMRTCHIHSDQTDLTGPEAWCPACTEEWEQRPNADTMSPEERAQELKERCGILEIEFWKVHQRIEELVGRPVWTHELAYPEQLIDEIRVGGHPTMAQILNKLPFDKKLIVVEAP